MKFVGPYGSPTNLAIVHITLLVEAESDVGAASCSATFELCLGLFGHANLVSPGSFPPQSSRECTETHNFNLRIVGQPEWGTAEHSQRAGSARFFDVRGIERVPGKGGKGVVG